MMITTTPLELKELEKQLFLKMMSFIGESNREEAIQIWTTINQKQYWAGWDEGFDKGYKQR